MASYVGRFAPTPSGPLHFGSLLTAVGSFLSARAAGGLWRLRLDDLDTPRIQLGAEAQICQQLRTYGLRWDGDIWRQSEHLEDYERAVIQLRQSQRIYACCCTRAELLQDARNGDETIYTGRCRHRNLDERGAALRLQVTADAETQVGDFVVRRKDGQYAYQLACAVDEGLMGITDVVRGSDLTPSTQRQMLILQALKLDAPHYRHLPLVVDNNGQKLSKQSRAEPLDGKDVIKDLCCALQLLGQVLPRDADRTSPDTILAAAAANWSVRDIPSGPVRLS
ncbi:MAG: tRNA glutamyl-Q(34) synthetase GluQRS [Panacagrimonas sp.]